MKMISSTSTTSTSGMMLISDKAVPEPRKRLRPRDLPFDSPAENAIPGLSRLLEIPFGPIEEFQREILHPRAHLLHRVVEIVVEHGRRNRREQADAGGDQRR